MKKKAILVIAVVLLSASSLVDAWEFDMKGEFKYNLNFTYASRHIWRGYDYFPSNDSVFYSSADFDFWDTGFGAGISWAKPLRGGHENWEWLVYDAYYDEDECWDDYWYEWDYRIGWRYYNHPDGPADFSCHNRDLDFQEFYARFRWPRLLPYNIVFGYEAARIWPAESGRRRNGSPWSYWRQYGGWFHTFGIYRDWELNGFLPKQPGQKVHTGFEIVYNDGAGPTVDTSKRNADHDFSHCLFSISTDIQIAKNIVFTPGFNHQVSMDQSVNNDNETWFTMNMKLEF